MTTAALSPNEIKEKKKEVRIQKYFDFIIDVYKRCKDGYQNIDLRHLREKHGVSSTVSDAMRNLNLIKSVGVRRALKFHWTGLHPDIIMAANLLHEHSRVDTNHRLLKDKPTKNGKLLVPVLKQVTLGGAKKEMLDCLNKIYDDLRGDLNVLIDTNFYKKHHGLQDYAIKIMTDLKIMTPSSMVPGGYLWVDAKPDKVMADLIVESKPKPAEETVEEQPKNNMTAHVDKMRALLVKVYELLKDGPRAFPMMSIVKDFKMPLETGAFLKRENIIVAMGSKEYKWIGEEPNDKLIETLAENLRLLINNRQSERGKEKTKEKNSTPPTPSSQPAVAAKPAVKIETQHLSPETNTMVINIIKDDLKKKYEALSALETDITRLEADLAKMEA